MDKDQQQDVFEEGVKRPPKTIDEILADMNSDEHKWHYASREHHLPSLGGMDKQVDRSRQMLIKIGICIIIVVVILLIKSVDTPFAQKLTGWITVAFTDDMDVKDAVGRLKFVQSIFPGIQQQVEKVFNDMGQSMSVQQTEAPPVLPGEQRIDMISPLNGKVTSKFGKRVNPIFQNEEEHTGIDIDGQFGAPVVAVADGVVLEVGENDVDGRFVRIKHSPEVETYYAHVAEVLVKPEQSVHKGDVIAKVGNGGLSTGSHLHFEVRYKGQPVDPLEWINPENQSSV